MHEPLQEENRTRGEKRTAVFAEAVSLYLAKKGGTLGAYDLKAIEKLNMRFGARRLADITDIDIVNFCADAYPKSGPHGHDRQVYTPLIAIYRIAAKAQPPLCDLPRFQRPAKPDRKKVAPATDQQLAQVLPHCSDRLAAALLLISFTGARASECCRLEEKDIDWERHEALLCETKNGESRMVPLPGLVYEALSKLKGRKGPIFGFKQRWSLNQAIARACRRAGVPVMTSHKFGRHAFAARLLGQGHTLKEVQEGGGWKSYPLVAKTYSHLEKSALHAVIRSSDKKLAQLIDSSPNVMRIQRAKK